MDARRVALVLLVLLAPAALRAQEACALLRPHDVSDILGVPVAGAAPPGAHTACTWAAPGDASLGSRRIVLTLLSERAFAAGRVAERDARRRSVAGLGDEAYETTLAPFGTTLSVRRGHRCLQLQVVGFSPARDLALERALARELLARLNPPAAESVHGLRAAPRAAW